MAKKDDKKKKAPKRDKGAVDAVEAVRSAVERTFAVTAEGAQSTRARAQDIADEVAGAAQKMRQTFDGVVDELRSLRGDVESLARRVTALELRPGSGGGSGESAARPRAAGTARAKASGTRSTAKRTATSRAKAAGGASKPATGRAKPAGGTAKSSTGRATPSAGASGSGSARAKRPAGTARSRASGSAGRSRRPSGGSSPSA